MILRKYQWILGIVLILGFSTSCKKDNTENPDTTVYSDFESGSIGEIIKLSDTKWELHLADDNNNPELPDRWRNWWYVKMNNMPTDARTEITLKNRGWPYYYVPVYSYDQEEWHRFNEDEVSQNINNELIIQKQFDRKTLWMARFYPYTFTDLEYYLNSIQNNPNIDIQTAGYSQENKPIFVLKITDFNQSVSNKKRIFMHARTHPAETPSSFLIEGMIDFLLSGSQEANEILAGFEFYIFPMQNVDGVRAGNYRSTPKSENLEVMWNYTINNPLNLSMDTPPEVAIIHQYAKDLMSDGNPPISMALNLHASNSEADIRPFFFPHFGTEAQGYSRLEASLWNKQISFISTLATHHGLEMIEPIPEEGGSSFTTKTYPESWWWINYEDQVMAITFEITYGRAGYAPRWIEPNDIRYLGSNLVLSIRDYYDETFIPIQFILKSKKSNLKFPELYPPNAVDELKK